MTENDQSLVETCKEEYYEDEIELIDILRVFWKWKFYIIAGTIAFGLIAAIISFNMSKIYSIDMVLRPGILSIGERGQNVYIDFPANIKALIDSNTFNHDILNYLKEIKINNVPKKLEFKVTIPSQSDTIKVQYETADIKQGLIIQKRLSKMLLEKYSSMVTYFKNEYDIKLDSLKYELDYIKGTIQSYKRNVKNIEKRIDELNSEIKLIKNNTNNLIKERNKLLSENPKEKDILSTLVYANTIQQNLSLSNNYQDDINYFQQLKEEELQKIEKSENEIANKLNDIKNLQFKKGNIQNIQFLQPATSSLYPVKPKKLLIIASASLFGLFLMIVLFFLIESVSRNKQ